MFFTTVNESAGVGIFNEHVSVDLESMAHEIEMECAIYKFENMHTAVESYHAVMEEEAAGGDDKGRFDKFKEKVGAVKDRFLKFLKSIWQRIKDMFNRVIYWVTTKISSNKSFAEKMGKENLGKVKVKYDYKTSFENMSKAQDNLTSLGDQYMKVMSSDYGKSASRDARNDSDKADEINERLLNHYNDVVGIGHPGSYNEIKDEFRKGIVVEKEEDVEGKTLLGILNSAAPTVDGFKRFNVGIMNFFKAIEGQIKNPKGDISVKVGMNIYYKFVSLISTLVSINIVSAQKLILAIRSDINRSKGGESAAAAPAGDAGKAEEKPAEGKTESALFGDLINTLSM